MLSWIKNGILLLLIVIAFVYYCKKCHQKSAGFILCCVWFSLECLHRTGGVLYWYYFDNLTDALSFDEVASLMLLWGGLQKTLLIFETWTLIAIMACFLLIRNHKRDVASE